MYKTTDKQYPDMNGNLPGSPDYCVTGAQVRYVNETTGKQHMWHPKYGVIEEKTVKERTLNVHISGSIKRDKLNAELAKAEATVRD